MLSLRNKAIIGIALIEVVLLFALIYTATSFVRQALDESLQKRAQTTTKLFATMTKDALLTNDLRSLENIVQEVMLAADIEYARIISPQNHVLARAGKIPSNQNSNPAVDVNLGSVNHEIYDFQELITLNSNTFARVQIGISTSQIHATLIRITQWSIGIALTELLLVAVFSYLLGNYLTSQLRKLTHSTQLVEANLGSGSFVDAKVDIHTKDELGEFTNMFNSLMDKIQKQESENKGYQEQLEQFNTDLERTVEQRTAELVEKNRALLKINLDLNKSQQQVLHAEKLASIGQLAAGFAHEINNPLSYVTSNLGSLKHYLKIYEHVILKLVNYTKIEEQSVKKQLLQEIMSNIQESDVVFVAQDMDALLEEMEEGLQRVTDIVQRLTVFSRTNNDTKQLVNINDCIHSTCKMVQKQVGLKATLLLELSELPTIYINVGKINQVLTNIIINASQAIEHKGEIKVSTQVVDNLIQVKISDNGCGIPEFQLSKIFDPFFTTKKEGEGTGLGLAISYDIMKEHAGHLDVESTVGLGTTFTLSFPVKDLSIH